MISQSIVQPTNIAITSGSVPAQPAGNGGLWAGLEVAIRDGVIPLLQSCHPGYVLPGMQPSAQPDEGPAFTFGSPDGQDSSLFQGVALAARLVSSCAELPEEIHTLLEGAVTFCAATRFRDLFGGMGSTTVSAPGQSRADSPEDGCPANIKGKKKTPQRTPQQTSPPATASARTGQLPKAAVALCVLSGLTAAGAASPSGSNPAEPIKVPDAETLNMIGSVYPLNGSYLQTKNIDGGRLSHSIGNKTHPFKGTYNGQDRTIYNLRRCLVDTVEGGGTIGNLQFTGANIITTSRPAGVVACAMGHHGTIHDIDVKNSQVITSGADAGIGVGVLSGGTVVNITATRSTVATTGEWADAGIGSGSIGNGAAISHITALGSGVETAGNNSCAAIGAGYVNGTVASTKAVHSWVTTFGKGGNAAIGGGKVDNGGTVTDTIAIFCDVKTTGERANAGIGAGAMGRGTRIVDTLARHSTVSTSGYGANAGIGAGSMGRGTSIADTHAWDSTAVSTSGDGANAGIGAGAMGRETRIADTLAQDSTVSTSGDGANAGIGAGRMGRSARVENTTAHCSSSVTTRGAEANAGIGAGFMDPRARIIGTWSYDSKVETSGVRAHAGIGAGMIRGNATVTDTRVVNSRATASGNHSLEGIPAGRIEPGGVATNATPLNTGFRESCGPATSTSEVTELKTPMSFSGLPGSTMAPLLSSGAIAGIALGAATAFVVAGGCIYYHYHHRSSPAAAGDQLELLATDTAGVQVEDQVDQPMV